MKAIVIYYSLEGNTKYVAEKIAENMSADILRLEPVKEYPKEGARKFIWGGKSVLLGERPKLKSYQWNKSDYDVILIGTPVWASSFAPPIRTFLKENDLSGKKLAYFICCAGEDSSKCAEKLNDNLTNSEILTTITFTDPRVNKSDEDTEKIIRFCNEIKNKIL